MLALRTRRDEQHGRHGHDRDHRSLPDDEVRRRIAAMTMEDRQSLVITDASCLNRERCVVRPSWGAYEAWGLRTCNLLEQPTPTAHDGSKEVAPWEGVSLGLRCGG
jgi:hypothetical protein